VLSIRIEGELSDAHLRKLSAAQLRSFVPKTMIVELKPRRPEDAQRFVKQAPERKAEPADGNLELGL
jgi:hypothetical protein